MLIIFICILLLSLAYSGLIAYFIYYWKKSIPPTHPTFPTGFRSSIIIAARNEEEHILESVQSCLKQKELHQEMELIVVDDQSEDDTYAILNAIEHQNFKLMRLGVYKRTTIKGSKKKALAYGINHAQGEIILTTDADCIVKDQWVTKMLDYFQEPQIQLVSGPVGIVQPKSFLDYLQALDFSANGLINAAGIQSGTHYLCNAANLAYRKAAFLNAEAYENNYEIASGDDVFLIEKIKEQYPAGICFAHEKELMVETYAIPGWGSFLAQRLRWAGKMRFVKSWKLSALSSFVWIQRISVFIALALSIYSNNVYHWALFAASFIIQCLSDFILQYHANHFYAIPSWKKWFLPVWMAHNIYFVLIGLLSWLPISHNWKGRKV
ncbi:MAG: glycosyltransferase [Saprospiraceae bacterium]|nr:glycosyltransferase [Saprospiraceae bacterium]